MKASGLQLTFDIFREPSTCYNKSKLHKTSEYRSRDMPNFNFSEKGLGLVSPLYFVHDFSRKMCLVLHSIN